MSMYTFPNLAKLSKISSSALCETKPGFRVECDSPVFCSLLRELEWLLSQKNGFYAFESALHVLPSTSAEIESGIDEWNLATGWKRHYQGLCDPILFFAEDIFCFQFGLSNKGVVRLEPETGKLCHHSPSVEGWAAKLLENYSEEVGWSLAHEWQKRNGPLPLGHRLLPRTPFMMMGGDYGHENFVAVTCKCAMEMIGRLCSETRNLPDGSQFVLRNWI